MSLADLCRTGRAPASAASISCPHYEASAAGKRCRHYLAGGVCERSGGSRCIEWLKANGQAAPAATVTASAPPVATDLFGSPLPAPARRTKARPEPAPSAEPCTVAPVMVPDPPRGLTTEDIESFRQLGVEVCLGSAAVGEVWLVPRYTATDRKELTPEHAATLCHVIRAFPGAQVVSFERTPNPQQGGDA